MHPPGQRMDGGTAQSELAVPGGREDMEQRLTWARCSLPASWEGLRAVP